MSGYDKHICHILTSGLKGWVSKKTRATAVLQNRSKHSKGQTAEKVHGQAIWLKKVRVTQEIPKGAPRSGNRKGNLCIN